MRTFTRAVATLIFAAPLSANAVLIDAGNTTQDTDTGLEWLDLTLTEGDSFNEALASSFVVNDGYRHATSTEVETLFMNAGVATGPSTNNPANDAAVTLLLDLLGCTTACDTVNALGRGFAVFNATFTVRPFYNRSGLGSGYAIISLFSANGDLIDESAGHYLVRDIRPPVAIAAPGTLALLGIGLALGGLARRRL